MIFVDRSGVPAPDILINEALKSGGVAETLNAIKFFKKKTNRGKPFAYRVYKNDAVKKALEDLFHKKCAYCESNYAHTAATDVEHWRPKGEVDTADGKSIKPGYYWLAADWDNLLPSCNDCNRQRYHEVDVRGGELVLLGKLNAFPLEAGSPRARRKGEEKDEKPLLLHPCKDRPDEHIEFAEEEDDNGHDKRGIVRAKRVNGVSSRKGEESIVTYALDRAELVLQRKKLFIRIQKQIERVVCAAERVKAATSAEVREQEEQIYNNEVGDLLDFVKVDEPYVAMARQLIMRFLRERGISS